MTSTTQPKSHKNTSKNTTDTVNIDNTNTATSYIGHTSKNLIPCKTMRPPKTSSFGTIPTPEFKANTTHSTIQPASRIHQVYSHSEPPTCCMHVHQQPSQTCSPGEPSSLREVKHPHRNRTSMNRSPSTEQGVLSQLSSYHEETGLFTRDPCTSQLKSSFQPTIHAPNNQMVNTCTNCEHSHRMEHAKNFPTHMEMCMDDHLTQDTGRIQRQHLQDITYEQNCLTHNIFPDSNFSHAEFPPGKENTPAFLGNQFLQGKEEITCTNMEDMNQSIQGNETNMDTCTFTTGSTTPSRHSMLSTSTHPRIVPQNFQQLEKESSNMMALPGFKHNAETATHMETSRNVHSNETLSISLKTDTNMYANMDTNHTAHRYRHTRKEDHLLSGPPELRPLKAMAHRDTRKEDHLLSGPSELQLTEDPETQKFDSAYVQHPRHEYSRSTETNKAKFQNPCIYNDERNFVRHNSVSKISPNLVYMTTPITASVSHSVFCRKKGRRRGKSRDSRKGRNSRNCRRTCTCTCTCTCNCNHTGDSP